MKSRSKSSPAFYAMHNAQGSLRVVSFAQELLRDVFVVRMKGLGVKVKAISELEAKKQMSKNGLRGVKESQYASQVHYTGVPGPQTSV